MQPEMDLLGNIDVVNFPGAKTVLLARTDQVYSIGLVTTPFGLNFVLDLTQPVYGPEPIRLAAAEAALQPYCAPERENAFGLAITLLTTWLEKMNPDRTNTPPLAQEKLVMFRKDAPIGTPQMHKTDGTPLSGQELLLKEQRLATIAQQGVHFPLLPLIKDLIKQL